VVKQMHGKHQRTVQFSHSAPFENSRLVKSLFLWYYEYVKETCI